jgi:hypothetical protein
VHPCGKRAQALGKSHRSAIVGPLGRKGTKTPTGSWTGAAKPTHRYAVVIAADRGHMDAALPDASDRRALRIELTPLIGAFTGSPCP